MEMVSLLGWVYWSEEEKHAIYLSLWLFTVKQYILQMLLVFTENGKSSTMLR